MLKTSPFTIFQQRLRSGILRFSTLDGQDPDSQPVFEHIIHELYPTYRDTIFSFVQKIREGKDRTCELLYKGDELLGLIIYKNHLSSEYAEYGIENGFELKTLFLFDPDLHSRKGFGSILLKRAADTAIRMGTTTIFGTVSASSEAALNFLLKNGFEVANIFKEKYVNGLDEYLICNKNIDRLV